MKIPKKITPDHIGDSIVELRYQSDNPFEVGGLLELIQFELIVYDYQTSLY